MAKIKVHVLNFHGLVNHVELMLENTSTNPHIYYGINRWANPQSSWSKWGKGIISDASSVYSFAIEADPETIVNDWNQYWNATKNEASILGKNCSVAAQWFLNRFAGIPNPNLSNISMNHLALGIFWPSFIPCPVTLAGRVVSNAKFYIEARNKTETPYMRMFIYASLALATLALAASIFALTVATTVLTGGLGTLAVAGCAVAIGASTYGFFKAYNATSATLVNKQQPKDKSMSVTKQDDVLSHDELAHSMSCAMA